MSFGLKILIFNSGRLQISRYISLVATYPVVQVIYQITVMQITNHLLLSIIMEIFLNVQQEALIIMNGLEYLKMMEI